MVLSTAKNLNTIVHLFSIKTILAYCQPYEIGKGSIQMLKFLIFPRSFGKQCFAVVDALYSKLVSLVQGILFFSAHGAYFIQIMQAALFVNFVHHRGSVCSNRRVCSNMQVTQKRKKHWSSTVARNPLFQSLFSGVSVIFQLLWLCTFASPLNVHSIS